MRLLFSIDARDYDPNGRAAHRPSARAIIIRDGRIALVHSEKYDYYKFPGGGIREGESHEAALIRETMEETGLAVIPESVREYGYVHRARKSLYPDADYFVQENYYYLCDVEPGVREQTLDDYEAEERFTLAWVEPMQAILANRLQLSNPKRGEMVRRETAVLNRLKSEGYFCANCADK